MSHPELYILRHGQTVWNAEDRMQGWDNSPLTPRGERDAARQGEILREIDLTGFRALCSPSGRAIQTAGIAVAPVMGMIETDMRLREIGVGDWTGVARADLPPVDGPDGYLAHYESAPNGEGHAKLRLRCEAFLADRTGPTVLITHGITSRMIRTILTNPAGMGPADVQGGQGCVYHVKNGEQTLLR